MDLEELNQLVDELGQLRDLARDLPAQRSTLDRLIQMEDVAYDTHLFAAHRWLAREINAHRFVGESGDIGVIRPS